MSKLFDWVLSQTNRAELLQAWVNLLTEQDSELDPDPELLSEVIRNHIGRTFVKYSNSKNKTAEALGIGRTTLYRLLTQLDNEKKIVVRTRRLKTKTPI